MIMTSFGPEIYSKNTCVGFKGYTNSLRNGERDSKIEKIGLYFCEVYWISIYIVSKIEENTFLHRTGSILIVKKIVL